MKKIIDEIKLLLKRPTSLQIMANELAEAEVLVLFRERTPITAALLERLPETDTKTHS